MAKKGENMTTQTEVSKGLKFVWGARLRFQVEGSKLRAEGSKLWAEGDKLRAEGSKLRAEGDKLWAEGDKLRAEGGKLWAEAVIEFVGNVKLEWKYVESKDAYSCTLEDGTVFEP